MLRLALYTVCIVLSLQGSLVESQGHRVCVLRDAPTQCGSFCLSALYPLFADTNNIRSRLDGIEAGQKVLSDLMTGLQGVHTKLDSCKMKNDYEARLAGIENHLKATIANLENQIKTKDDLINAQKKQIDEGFKNKDDEIADLKNQINSIETSKRNQSNELSECRLHFEKTQPLRVSCSSSPHGWTVIQRRIDGSENFDRNWADYKNGFGNVKGEFFIGLEKLHQMTKARPHELYIKLGK
ncbi:fibrinogen-like protein 1 isoform X2 [Drosophila gunungcola]|nr:fibrinogen-like protein 1 isoform X2 [Drosophila gunungcola]